MAKSIFIVIAAILMAFLRPSVDNLKHLPSTASLKNITTILQVSKVVELSSKPAFIPQVPSYGTDGICIYINDQPFWQPSDYSPELGSLITDNFRLIIDDVILQESDLLLTGGGFLATFPIGVFDGDELQGTYNGILQGCFSTKDFTKGFHRAVIELRHISDEKYFWGFWIGEPSSTEQVEATITATLPLSNISQSTLSVTCVHIEPSDLAALSANPSIFELSVSIREGYQKFRIMVNENEFFGQPDDISNSLMYPDVEVSLDGQNILYNRANLFGGSDSVDEYDQRGHVIGSHMISLTYITFYTYDIELGEHTLGVTVTSQSGITHEKTWYFDSIENSLC